MRIATISIAILFLFNSRAFSQLYPFQFDWKKAVQPFGTSIFDNTSSYKIAEIPGVGFVWAGQKKDDDNAQDLWLQKIDYNGNILWDTTFGGDFYETPRQLRVLSDGSFIVAAQSGSTNISIQYHWDDVVLVKYSAGGHLDWWKRYGSLVSAEDDIVYDLRVCQDGGFVVAGGIEALNTNGTKRYNAWIFKTDALGNTIWSRNYGGYWEDLAWAVQPTADGGYAVAVSSMSSDGDFDINTHETDPWLVKLDKDGFIEWKRHYGGTESEFWYFISPTPDGGFILSGEIEPGSDLVSNTYGVPWDAWVCRVSSTGELLWSKNFGGSKWDAVREMTNDGTGLYWHSGFTLSNDFDICRNRGEDDVWVFAVDLDGNLSWSQTFGGSGYDEGQGICCIPDGLMVCGNVNSKDGDVGPIEPYQSGWLLKIENPETFHIRFPVSDTTFCGSGAMSLYADLPDSIGVTWNTNHNGHELDITQPGLYAASASLYGCSTSDTLVLSVLPRPELRGDTLLCYKDSLLLAPNLPVDKILWNTGSVENAIWAHGSKLYSAAMQVQECLFKDSVSIRGKWCDEEGICLPVPNAFSPNGDGANDTFSPINQCEIAPLYVQLEIFNRWGEKIYASAGPSWPHWDGQDQPSDVYVWHFLLTFESEGDTLAIQDYGEVTLIR